MSFTEYMLLRNPSRSRQNTLNQNKPPLDLNKKLIYTNKTTPSVMSYLKFDKNLLINLDQSLPKEMLRTNQAGAYLCTTLVGAILASNTDYW